MVAKIIQTIEQEKILAVVRCDNCQKAIDISKALIDGGLKTLEITTNFENCYKAIEEISKIDGVLVAAGSIITNNQAVAAINFGAKLIVSPVMDVNLIKLSKGRGVQLITGVSTANEAYNAWKLGVNITKIFPVKAMGGSEYIKDILKPMSFLKLMPTSGVQIDNFMDYLDAGAVAVGMGRTLYEDTQNYAEITKRAKAVINKLNNR